VEALRDRFEGRLVVVEPLAPVHFKGLVEAATEGEIFTWFPTDVAASPATVRAWLDGVLADAHRITFAILDARGGQPVGSTSFLEIRLEHLRAEIGFTWHAPRVWGTGVNVETKLLLLGHAFERVGLRRVEFKTDARNERSRGALLAMGATFEGIFRKHMVVRNGDARDSAYYSVIDDDWPAVKAGLERRLRSLEGDEDRAVGGQREHVAPTARSNPPGV
jgi:RimJ/RimL family protein N-acetyltransferase